MTKGEAIEAIKDGHTIYSPEFAKQVCETLGVVFSPKELVKPYHSESHPLGVHMLEGHEGDEGVWSLSLSLYIATKLGVKDKATGFLGRGSQAREYARVIAEKLGIKNESH